MKALKEISVLLTLSMIWVGGTAAICLSCGTPSNPPEVTPPTVPSRISKFNLSQPWEYKTVIINTGNHERTGPNALASNDITVDEAAINVLGKDGWELTSSYIELETAFPNLSDNAKYVTGLESNVRSKRGVLIFKRPVNLP